jgi:hypothetical protein
MVDLYVFLAAVNTHRYFFTYVKFWTKKAMTLLMQHVVLMSRVIDAFIINCGWAL